MVTLGPEVGWALAVIGVILLLIEIFQPGFFIAIPATVLIVLGVLTIIEPAILTQYGPLIAIIVALIATAGTLLFYRRIAPGGEPPYTTSMDTLVGRTGKVTRAVSPDDLTGKVRIANQVWSARSVGPEISEGEEVVVVASEGVHVKVKRKED